MTESDERRHDRRRLHGQGACHGLCGDADVLLAGAGHPAPQGRRRRHRRHGRDGPRPLRLRGGLVATGAPWSPGPTSTSSTSARPTTSTPRSPSPRPKAGKHIICEKPLARTVEEATAMARRRRGGRRHPHGRLQLPPHARRGAGQEVHRRGPHRRHPELPRHLSAGLVRRSRWPAVLALPEEDRRLGLGRRHRHPRRRPRALSGRRDRRGQRDDHHLQQDPAPPAGRRRQAGRGREAPATPSAARSMSTTRC